MFIEIQPFEGLQTELAEHIFTQLSKCHPHVQLLKAAPLPYKERYKASKVNEEFETIIIDDNLQNSIGNLVMLEEVINRSIQHAPFLKSDKSNKCNKNGLAL